MRSWREYLMLYLKGLSMGTADVIPGVSGGTIAFITGIYDELIASIRALDATAFRLLFRFELKALWRHVNGAFLVAVLSGLGTSLVSLAGLMTYLLGHFPIPVWSFFFGLILVSAPLIFRDISRWSSGVWIALAIGAVAAYVITVLSPTETPSDLWFIFLCGALAICAMILPGISGAFILLLIGKYQYMISALIGFDLPVILVFVAGCVIGLTAFSHVLSWLLSRYRDLTLALLSGFMLGSLNKVWPWKEVTAWRTDHSGELVPAFDRSVWPGSYAGDPQLWQALAFAVAGVLLVVVIEWLAKKSSNRTQTSSL